jgi:hypothetical protein
VLLEDVVEIADRLVEMEAEDEAERLHDAHTMAMEREPLAAAEIAGSRSGNS